MNQLLHLPPDERDQAERDDPFFYGFRYVTQTLEDGTETIEQVPLTEEDILYPLEDDHISQKPPHRRDTDYFHSTLRLWYQHDASVAVLADVSIDWEVPGLRPPCPDNTVIFGVRVWRQEATYLVKQEGGRPVLLIEVTSPATYYNDIRKKPPLYHQVGVDCFVTVDRGPKGKRPVRLHVRRWAAPGWIDVPPDAQGRYDLAPVPLKIGIEGDDRVWLYDAVTGRRLPDDVEREAQAQAEARARAVLEERLRQLEEQLRGPSGEGTPSP